MPWTLKLNRCRYPFESLPFFFGTATVAASVHHPLGETEGAEQRIKLIGLFIELSGLYGCRHRMCQSGGKSSIDQSLPRYVALFWPTLNRDVGLGDNSSLHHRLHLPGAAISTDAFLPPQRSLLPHRWVDLAEHAPNLAPFSQKLLVSGWLIEHIIVGVWKRLWCTVRQVCTHTAICGFLQWNHVCGCAGGGFRFIDGLFFCSSQHWGEDHLLRERQGQVMLIFLCNDPWLGCRVLLLLSCL